MTAFQGYRQSLQSSLQFNIASGDGLIVSQVSFDIRDFFTGGEKPNLSGGIGNLFLPSTYNGTVRFDSTGNTPNDALGVDGDYVVGPEIYQRIDGHYTLVSSQGGLLRFTYQGWRAVGVVAQGPDLNPILGRSVIKYNNSGFTTLRINTETVFAGDILIQ